MRLILYNFNEICLISFYGVVLTIMLWDQWNKKNLSFWKEPGNVQTNSSVSLLYAALQSKLVWLILRTFSRDIFRWSPPEEVWWRLFFAEPTRWPQENSIQDRGFRILEGSKVPIFWHLKMKLPGKSNDLYMPQNPQNLWTFQRPFNFGGDWMDPTCDVFFNLALPRERPLVMFVL